MPRRQHYARQESSETSSTVSESEIPWFGNFGKYVENAEFLLNGSSTADSHPSQRDYTYQEMQQDASSQMQSVRNLSFTAILSTQHPHSREYRPQPDVNMRRVSSEQMHSNSAQLLEATKRAQRKMQRKGSESDGEAPSTLGAILRRMVSFDAYQKRVNSNAHERVGAAYGAMNRENNATGQMDRNMRDINPTTDGFIRAPGAGGRGTNSARRFGHPLDKAHAPVFGSPHVLEKKRHIGMFSGGRHDSDFEAAPKTLGAILRRMVSFDG